MTAITPDDVPEAGASDAAVLACMARLASFTEANEPGAPEQYAALARFSFRHFPRVLQLAIAATRHAEAAVRLHCIAEQIGGAVTEEMPFDVHELATLGQTIRAIAQSLAAPTAPIDNSNVHLLTIADAHRRGLVTPVALEPLPDGAA